MTRLPISSAAAALLRALAARARVSRDRILLTDGHSTDWQSLTFTGERHRLALRIPGCDAPGAVERLCNGLEDAEFSIAGLIVADVVVAATPQRTGDGSVELTIEALTIAE